MRRITIPVFRCEDCQRRTTQAGEGATAYCPSCGGRASRLPFDWEVRGEGEYFDQLARGDGHLVPPAQASRATWQMPLHTRGRTA